MEVLHLEARVVVDALPDRRQLLGEEVLLLVHERRRAKLTEVPEVQWPQDVERAVPLFDRPRSEVQPA